MRCLRVDVKRKRFEVGRAYKVTDDKVVKRECEAHHQAGNDTGHNGWQFHAEKGLHRCATKIKCRLCQILIHLAELWKHLQNYVRQVERGVCNQHRPKAKGVPYFNCCTNANEQKHHRNTRYDIGVHHRNVCNRFERLAVIAIFCARNAECCQCADGGGNNRGADSQNKRIFQSIQCFAVGKELLIPIQRKGAKIAQITRFVKGEQNNDEYWRIKDQKDQRYIELREKFHMIISSPLSENLFIIAREIKISTIITSEIAAPV